VTGSANVTLPPGSGPTGVAALPIAGVLVVSMGAASYLYVPVSMPVRARVTVLAGVWRPLTRCGGGKRARG
jgi:hypothetical protein